MMNMSEGANNGVLSLIILTAGMARVKTFFRFSTAQPKQENCSLYEMQEDNQQRL